jgi:hypothetical protein
LPFNLHLKSLHETFTIKNALASRILLARLDWRRALGSVGCGDVLGVSQHQVELSRLEFVALGLLSADGLQGIHLGLESIYPTLLSFDKPGLLVKLTLHLGHESIRSKFNPGTHLVSLGHGGLGDLAGLEGLILRLSSLRIRMQLVQ